MERRYWSSLDAGTERMAIRLEDASRNLVVDGSLRDRGGFFWLGYALVDSEAVLGHRSQISVLIASRASRHPKDSFFEVSSVMIARECFRARSRSGFLSSLVQRVRYPVTRSCAFTCNCFMIAFTDSFHPDLFSYLTLIFQHYLYSIYVSLSFIGFFFFSSVSLNEI